MRYYNKLTKTEAIEGVHTIDENCVQLPDDNVFFQPLPVGKEIVYIDDIPTSLQDVVIPLDTVKAIKWDEVKTLRSTRNDEDITTSEGTWQVDTLSIANINSGIMTLTDNLDTISWLDTNNNLIEINKEQLNNILIDHATRKISIFNASLNVKADIDACTAIEEVNALGVASLLSTYTI